VAGVLAHLDYFDSPRSRPCPRSAREAGAFSDAQLEQLISANVVAVTKRRGLGIIVAKGLLTSGRQINVPAHGRQGGYATSRRSLRSTVGRLNDEGSPATP